MSGLKLNKKTCTNDDENNSNSDENENSDTTIDMDMVEQKETAKPREIRIAESEKFLCSDIENSLEPPADEKEEMSIDIGKLIDLKDLKISVISQVATRRKYTIMGMYDYMFGGGQQEQQAQPPRYTNQVWRQVPPQQQPQQSMWTQYGPSQGQGPGYGDNAGYPAYGAYGYDGGGPLIYDPRSRNSFVALVMSIVFVMLAATAAFLGIVLALPEMREFFQVTGWVIVIPALFGIVIVNCTMICSPCGRRPPCNFILLFFATASMSVMAAWITSHYKTEVILFAFLATGAVVFVCIVLACSKFDFTSYMLYIIVIATAFSVIAMIVLVTMMLTGNMMKPLILVILIIGTLIQSMMLVTELQMILGGRTIEISEADYALAAFLIYTSILDIFLKLVHIIGMSSQ